MPTQERLRKLAIVAAVALAVLVPVALLARSQSDDSRARDEALVAPTATPAPTPTTPPADPTATPPPATPAGGDTASSVSEAEPGSDGDDEGDGDSPAPFDISGAPGSRCTLAVQIDNADLAPVAAFTVPRTAQAPGCGEVEPGGWVAPEPAVRLDFRARTSMVTVLDEAVTEPDPGLAVSDVAYAPSATATGWRIAYEHADAVAEDRGGFLRQLFTVPATDDRPGGVLIIDSGDAAWSDAQRRQAHALFSDVYATTAIVGGLGDIPQPGGLCSGTEWAAPVPRGWFAYNGCRHFNTSSEALDAMQCECLGPFSVREIARTEPLSNTQLRSDGLRYTITEAFRSDDVVGDRNYRTIHVELPSTTLEIEAVQQIDHAFPGHTWDDTLLAQDRFLADLVVADVGDKATFELTARWPAVGDRQNATVTRTPLGPDRWILSTEPPAAADGTSPNAPSPIGVQGVVTRAASGRMTLDGLIWSPADRRNRCEATDQDHAVRVTPNGAAWTLDLEPCGSELDIVLDGLAPPVVRDECVSDATLGTPPEAPVSLGVDVDGDRIDEHVFLTPDDAADVIDVVVVFDDGAARIHEIDLGPGGIDIEAGSSYRSWALPPAGPGAELLLFDAAGPGGSQAYALAFDLGDCDLRTEVLSTGPWARWCFVRSTETTGPLVRTWNLVAGDDGAAAVADDSIVSWNGATLTRAPRSPATPPPCGRDLPAAE